MSALNAQFLQQLRATFKVEAAEHLQAIGAGLLELEKTPDPQLQQGIVETVFRAAHSLKGAARAVEFGNIESVCQSLEDTFAAWKRRESIPSAQALDTIHAKLNAITSILSASQDSPAGPPVANRPGPSAAQDSPALPPDAGRPVTAEGARAPVPDTVRIGVALLDAVLVDSGEMLTAKLAGRQRVEDLRELAGATAAQLADPLLPEAGRRQVKSIEDKLASLIRAAEQDSDTVGRQVDDLLGSSRRLLLLPFATITASLPKLVRDLSRDQGKEVDLRIDGEQIEIDKRILEEIKDPLLHLLRNSVDHGIEPPAERSRRGKPARAQIRISASQTSGGNLQIVVSDDGAGIDADRVKAAAAARGLISPQEAQRLTEAQAHALVFRSDVSTSAILTSISGRGLGLAIVREKAIRLGGEVSVESKRGLGTVFRIDLPALRATFRGILFEAAGRLLVLPTTEVQRVARARPDDVRTVEGCHTMSLEGRALPLVALGHTLELPPAPPRPAPAGGVPVLIVGDGDRRMAFSVDEVLGEQEMMFKPLGRPLSRVRNVAAVAVLANGRAAPVLNVSDLLRSVLVNKGAPAWSMAAAKPVLEKKSVLVAEDSITSRTLIRGILESAGYKVATAVDGMDAFARLRAEKFDLLVSDVEMPRLNGYDLTARIRADQKMAELPVVLVTALETREDRERGIDVGASAYIVKSGFDQSTLIEAVRRLI